MHGNYDLSGTELNLAKLTEENFCDYDEFLQNCEGAMFTHSLKYKRILAKILDHVSDHYICVYQNKKIIAALPLFFKYGSKGLVVNSLPFYGSHGGLLTNYSSNNRVFELIKLEILKIINRKDFLALTLVETPSRIKSIDENLFKANFYDQRISQITYFPTFDHEKDLDEKLLKIIHSKTRNMVRKGLSQNFKIEHSSSMDSLKAIYKIHYSNITALSGKPKPFGFFEKLSEIFTYDLDYRVYYAKKDNEIVAGLLLFYFKDTVEYFTPAIINTWRDKQPLSAIIFQAMKDAISDKKMKRWNWGGTWKNQDGVYRFKSRWGATDSLYGYNIISNCYLSSFKKSDRDKLLNEYSHFYIEPVTG